jgi:hypothetical protein
MSSNHKITLLVNKAFFKMIIYNTGKLINLGLLTTRLFCVGFGTIVHPLNLQLAQ